MPCHRCRVLHPARHKSQARDVPSGRWMKVQGRFKMQVLTPYCAHTRQYTVDSAGRWRTCLGRFKMQALTHCDAIVMSTRTAVGQSKGQFNGAMEDMSGKVQNANTHILRCQNHEHTHSSQSVQGQVQWGDGGNVWEGSKCKHSHTATPTS